MTDAGMRRMVVACVLLAVGMLVVPARAMAKQETEHGKAEQMMKHKSSAEKEGEREESWQYKECKSRLKRSKKMEKMLMDAKKTAESEDADATVKKLDKILDKVEKCQADMKKQMKKMKEEHAHKKEMKKGDDDNDDNGDDNGEVSVVNPRCPIMGTKLDQDDVPAKLTRTWKGKKVGFCCKGCPTKWDKLSNEQKRQKLNAAMAESDD